MTGPRASRYSFAAQSVLSMKVEEPLKTTIASVEFRSTLTINSCAAAQATKGQAAMANSKRINKTRHRFVDIFAREGFKNHALPNGRATAPLTTIPHELFVAAAFALRAIRRKARACSANAFQQRILFRLSLWHVHPWCARLPWQEAA